MNFTSLVDHIFEHEFGGAVTDEQMDALVDRVIDEVGSDEIVRLMRQGLRKRCADTLRRKDPDGIPRVQRLGGWYVGRRHWGPAEYKEAARKIAARRWRDKKLLLLICDEGQQRFGIDLMAWLAQEQRRQRRS